MAISREQFKPIIWFFLQSISLLKAVVSSDRANGQLRIVHDAKATYFYDSTSMAVPDDVLVVKPNDVLITDPGRWIRTDRSSYNYLDIISVLTNGQTIFTLTKTPVVSSSVIMNPIGGPEQAYGTDYTVTGTTVTYSGTVTFSAGEVINFNYNTFDI